MNVKKNPMLFYIGVLKKRWHEYITAISARTSIGLNLAVMLIVILIATSCQSNPGIMNQEAEEEPYIIAIENLSLGQDYKDTELVESAINDIIMPLINCKVDIVNYHIANHDTNVTLAVAGGDKLDLINTGLTTSLASHITDGNIIPLETLLASYAPKLMEKEGALLQATTIDGHVYAVPSSLYPSKANGLGVNQTLLDVNGLSFPEEVTLEALTELGKQLKQKDPNAFLINSADGSLSIFDVFYFSETFGVDYSLGVIFNPLVSTSIVNVYDTEVYRDYCLTLREWYELGLIPEEALTWGLTGQDVFNAGNVLLQQQNISPIGDQIVHKKGLPFEEILVATTPNVLSLTSVQEYAWGITTTCEQPDKVMQFLELLYTREDLANLFSHGIEGLHYEKVSERIIRYPDGVDGVTVGYGKIFSMYGDAMQQYQFEPATEDYYEELRIFVEEAQPLKTYGYSFDASAVASELLAVQDVINEFRPLLESGVIEEVDEALEQFNEALSEAGIERIIEANQAQLNAWLEE